MSIEKIKVCIQVNGRISLVANEAHTHTHTHTHTFMVNLVVKTALLCSADHDVEKIKERERDSIHSQGFVSIFASDQ